MNMTCTSTYKRKEYNTKIDHLSTIKYLHIQIRTCNNDIIVIKYCLTNKQKRDTCNSLIRILIVAQRIHRKWSEKN